MIPLVCFDTETTDKDPETARIVSAAVVILDSTGYVLERREWLVDPGIEIPAEATKIHRITTERVREHGISTEAAVLQILATLNSWHLGDDPDDPATLARPLAIMNAPYDLTLLDRECRRVLGHGMFEHMDEAEGELVYENWLGVVLDPFVIDKHVYRFRKGSRILTALAEHYGVPFEGTAHGAAGDAITAGRIVQRMTFPPGHRFAGERVLERMTSLDDLHAAQKKWKREQSQSFVEYLIAKGNGDEAALVDASWPIRELGVDVPLELRPPVPLDPMRYVYDNPYGSTW